MKITGMIVYEPKSGADYFAIRCRQCKHRFEGNKCKIRGFCIKKI